MSILRRFTDFILRSRLQAMGAAFVFAYIPFLGSISILIAGLVTLRKGMLEGFWVLCAATVPILLSYYATLSSADQANMALIAVGIVVVSNILVWLYAVLLRQYENWSLLLELSILVSMLIIGAVHFFNPDIQHWWSTQLSSYFTRATAMMNGLPGTDVNMQSQVVNVIKPYATGLVLFSVLGNGLLQVVMARWWQTVLFMPGTLRQELYHIRFGYVVGVFFVGVLLLSLLGNATALDMKPVFYGLFFIAGLSLIHCLLASVKYNWIWLVLFYAGLILFFPRSGMLVAVFALLDVLLNLRCQLTRVRGSR
ncbi:MAG: hypothetical protein K0S27_1592 [Gammaproteobacteria bacterium]|jgi:hypothetical protein|nr:hypothetical protein [Gammaproteobacteria bacterium]